MNALAEEILDAISAHLDAHELFALVKTGDKLLFHRLFRSISRIDVEYKDYTRNGWPNFVSYFPNLKHISVGVGSDPLAISQVSVRGVSYSTLSRGLQTLKLRFKNASLSLRDFMATSPSATADTSSSTNFNPWKSQTHNDYSALADWFPNLQVLDCPFPRLSFASPAPTHTRDTLYSFPATMITLRLSTDFPFTGEMLRFLPRTLLTLEVCFAKTGAWIHDEPTGVLAFPPNLTDLTFTGGPASCSHFRHLPRTLTRLRQPNTHLFKGTPDFAQLPRALTYLELCITHVSEEEASKLPRGLTHLLLVGCGNNQVALFRYSSAFPNRQIFRELPGDAALENFDASQGASSDSQSVGTLQNNSSSGESYILPPRLQLYDDRGWASVSVAEDFAALLPRTMTYLPALWTTNVSHLHWSDLPRNLQDMEVRGWQLNDHSLSSNLPALSSLVLHNPTAKFLENLPAVNLSRLVLGSDGGLVLNPTLLNRFSSLRHLELRDHFLAEEMGVNFKPQLESLTLDKEVCGAHGKIDWSAEWTKRLKTLRIYFEARTSILNPVARLSLGPLPSLTCLELSGTVHPFLFSSQLAQLPKNLERISITSLGVDTPLSECLQQLPPILREFSISLLVPKNGPIDYDLSKDFTLRLPTNLLVLELPDALFKKNAIAHSGSATGEIANFRPHLDIKTAA